MATLTNEQIEQLKQQLKEKQEEVKEIYDKLVEAGAVPIADDFLDEVAGGGFGAGGLWITVRPSYSRPAPTLYYR